ncbi:MAG: lysophospholipid acyltransferase family protein [bacterium]|nr:lysophospholipid acyltransferase family protein [bacterium]
MDAILALLRLVPERMALAMAAAFGAGYARMHGPRTADAMVNLRIAFPEWSDEKRRDVMVRSCANLGRGLAEFARIGSWTPEELQERVAVEGFEYLKEAIETSPNGGVLAVTAHFGSWEILAAAMVARGVSAALVHRPRENPLFDAMLGNLRGASGAELLARGNAARGVLEGLKKGRAIAMPYDQNCRRREGVFIPFFGRLACTRDGPPRIAMRTGVPVIPVLLFRQPDGIHHVARFGPPIELVPEGDDKADAVRENALRMTRPIEDAIREAPDQWIWIHRRWRTQPQGERHPY